MKRLAAVLAAAVLGTGCIVTDDNVNNVDYGSVNLYWDFVRSAPALPPPSIIVYDDSDTDPSTLNGPCDESAVDFVTVDSPVGQTVVDCVYAGGGPVGVEGVGIDGIPEGTRSFRVRGWRTISQFDYLVYDRTFNLAVPGRTITDHFLDVTGVSEPLDMFGYLAFGTPPGETDYASCAAAIPAGSAVPPNIGFEVRDVYGTLVDDGFVGCSDPLPALVFAGSLELDDFKVRMIGYRAEDDAVVFDSCWYDLAHFTPQLGAGGFAPTLLTQPIPSCPAFP